jgi:hypothetical protein
MQSRAMLLIVAVSMIMVLFSSALPIKADSTSLENKENFRVTTSTYDESLLVGSVSGHSLTAGDILFISWEGNQSGTLSPPRVYLLNDYQFHGWDYFRKLIFLDPASRGWLLRNDSWEMTLSYSITSSGTYYVIIDNPNWIPDILPPSIDIISYQAVQNYPNSYYLSVKTDPDGVVSVPGEGWYLRNYDKMLNAPLTVVAPNGTQYRFEYWDVDGSSYGIGVNPITVRIDANHTATAHYVLHQLLEHKASFFVTTSTYDQALLVGSVTGYSLTARQILFISWKGHEYWTLHAPRIYLLNQYQFGGWRYSRKLIGLDPASRGWLLRIDSWETTINYTVTTPDTYHVIIDNPNWDGSILPPSIEIIYYDAYLDLPDLYYLSIKTDPEGITSISGEGWYTEGSNPVLSAPTTVSVSSNTQYRFEYWDVDGVLRGIGVDTITIGMDMNHTATAHYVLQCQVTFDQTGLDSSATSTVVTINGAKRMRSNLPYVFWVDCGRVIAFSYNETVLSSTAGKRFVLTSVTGPASPITVTNPVTVIGNYKTQFEINFSIVGAGSDFTGTAIIIDGTGYTLSTLPPSFWWDKDSVYTFAFQSPLVVTPNAKQYVWTSTTGLSALQSGNITVTGSGSVTGNYKTRYYLAVTSPYDSPNPSSGWFDSGTSITASVTSPWSGPSGTCYVCTGWTGTGTVPASGTNPTVSFTITEPSSIIWNWKTQYLLTVQTDPSGLSPQPTRNPMGEAGSANSGWYDASTNVVLTAQQVAGYTFTNWDVDGTSQGNKVNPITINLNAPRTAIAHYTQKQPLSISISPLSADISLGQSVTFTSTVNGGTPPYSYQWYSNSNPVSGATTDRWTFTPSTTGVYYIYLEVTDADNTTAQSETARVTVRSVPVGGYSVPIKGYTTTKPLIPYLVLMTILIVGFTTIKRKATKRKTK